MSILLVHIWSKPCHVCVSIVILQTFNAYKFHCFVSRFPVFSSWTVDRFVLWQQSRHEGPAGGKVGFPGIGQLLQLTNSRNNRRPWCSSRSNTIPGIANKRRIVPIHLYPFIWSHAHKISTKSCKIHAAFATYADFIVLLCFPLRLYIVSWTLWRFCADFCAFTHVIRSICILWIVDIRHP